MLQDVTTNPHWTGEEAVQEDTGMVARFRQRYGSTSTRQQKPTQQQD